MVFFSDPAFLDSVGYVLIAVGSVGLLSLIISNADPRLPRRTLGVVLVVVAVGGAGLLWRAGIVRHEDRDLSPAQQASLSRAISQFPDIRFEVYSLQADEEARSLALKIVDAVQAASGTRPPSAETLPSVQKGVVLVMRDDGSPRARTITDTVGRVLMAARVAVISDREPELDDGTVRIVVWAKP